jgi:NAD(P)-dependent dehydrogenase (short-subunit alcohol dehydrogenase family)
MAYTESKLCDVLLAFALARRWREGKSNALEPGRVPTKMGGRSVPDEGFPARRASSISICKTRVPMPWRLHVSGKIELAENESAVGRLGLQPTDIFAGHGDDTYLSTCHCLAKLSRCRAMSRPSCVMM